MRKRFVKIYAVVFLTAIAVLALLNLCNTGGNYRAVIYYEKTKEGYVLKGVEIYQSLRELLGITALNLSQNLPLWWILIPLS